MSAVLSDWLSTQFAEVAPFDFYRDLFPEGELERRGEYVDGKYCGIAVRIVGREKAMRYSVTDDLDVVRDLVESSDFCVMSPVSYAGKTQKQSMARFLYAVVFDLDGVKVRDGVPVGLIDFMHQTTLENAYALPRPTYVVSSGTGVHLYYLLKRPIPLFRNVIQQLGALRKDLCKKIWNSYVTNLSANVQFESVTQGFRMVGTVGKDGVTRVRAFRTGEKVTIGYLNGFCAEENRVNTLKYESSCTLDQAKELYPEWYESRIVNGEKAGSWLAKRALYDWWKRKIHEGAVDGHRYFCIMALAIFARKSECRERTEEEKERERREGKKVVLPCVSWDELEDDALGFVEPLDARSVDPERNPFTTEDVVKALEAYNADYQTFPRKSIEALTGIEMPANKRNGRKREKHLEYINGMNRVRRSMGEDLGAGRPSKERLVRDFASEHPDMSNRQIADALGVSRNTVNRWRKR